MKSKSFHALVCAVLLAAAACIVPPSMFERASWGPPPDYWQDQGRFRQQGSEPVPNAATQAEPPAPEPLTTSVDPMQGSGTGESARPLKEEKAPLYAWDGGVVDGAPQGRVETAEGTPRGLETPPAGRMHIIELYQQVLDERDSLAGEVERLRSNLELTTHALESKTQESNDLAARVAALETSHRELMGDNQAIAARLVQAQIRRLEAEKLLLETRIEIERAKEEASMAAAAAQTRSTPGKSKKAPEPTAGGHE